MKTALAAALLALAAYLPEAGAAQESRLLFSVPGGTVNSLSCAGSCPPPPSGTRGVVFALAADWRGFYGGSKLLGLDAGLALGDAQRSFATGQTGSMVFDTGNSPDFSGFADALSSGAGLDLYAVNLIMLEGTTLNGQPFGGSAGGVLWNANDIAGAKLDFVRLRVNSVNASVGTDGYFAYSYATDVQWEFWGTLAAPVPEPSGAALLLLGLGSIVPSAVKRRRRAGR